MFRLKNLKAINFDRYLFCCCITDDAVVSLQYGSVTFYTACPPDGDKHLKTNTEPIPVQLYISAVNSRLVMTQVAFPHHFVLVLGFILQLRRKKTC